MSIDGIQDVRADVTGVGPVAIVGASLAGLNAARALREAGFTSELVIYSAEDRLPYDRPPLSKGVMRGEIRHDDTELLEEGELSRFDLRLQTPALQFDAASLRLRTAEGWSKPYSGGVVIATGATPRLFANAPARGVHVLRTYTDAVEIAAALSQKPRNVVVVGGGFIGAEVAASARQLGLTVTIIEVDAIPFARILGDEVGTAITENHRRQGIEFITGTGVASIDGDEVIRSITLADGRVIPADIAIVGIGVIPEVGWLADSGIRTGDGVMCDQSLSAAPFVVAAGDVANWPNGATGEHRRVEHWDNAIKQGRHAAGRLLADHGVGSVLPFEIVPWVWSDQFEMKMQIAGATRGADEVRIVHGSIEEGRFVALYRKGDQLVGAFCMNRVKQMMAYRRMLETKPTWIAALDYAEPKV